MISIYLDIYDIITTLLLYKFRALSIHPKTTNICIIYNHRFIARTLFIVYLDCKSRDISSQGLDTRYMCPKMVDHHI